MAIGHILWRIEEAQFSNLKMFCKPGTKKIKVVFVLPYLRGWLVYVDPLEVPNNNISCSNRSLLFVTQATRV